MPVQRLSNPLDPPTMHLSSTFKHAVATTLHSVHVRYVHADQTYQGQNVSPPPAEQWRPTHVPSRSIINTDISTLLCQVGGKSHFQLTRPRPWKHSTEHTGL